jgi:thioredoxin-like negative regulator of GroEL
VIEMMLEAERALAVGLIDQADRLFGQVVAADPRNSIAMVGLARVALERGDERGAYLAAKRALAIDPDNPMASHMAMRMAEILRARGETLPAGSAASGAPASGGGAPAPDATRPPAGSRRRPGIVGRILRRGGTR